jgi:hypothetical protein
MAPAYGATGPPIVLVVDEILMGAACRAARNRTDVVDDPIRPDPDVDLSELRGTFPEGEIGLDPGLYTPELSRRRPWDPHLRRLEVPRADRSINATAATRTG